MPHEPGHQTAVDELIGNFPWLAGMPGMADLIRQWIIEGRPPQEIVALVRRTDEYQTVFPAMFDENGQMRFRTEAEYLSTVADYRDVMREFGAPDQDYNDPLDFVGFMEQGIDPDELRDRWTIYKNLESLPVVADAFYVYAGMELSVDDMYRAVVNPNERKALVDEYNARVALNPPSFDEWITRATEVSVRNMQKIITNLAEAGVIAKSKAELVKTAGLEPAKRIMARLYLNAAAQGKAALTEGFEEAQADALLQRGPVEFINLFDLQQAFQFAMIGSAASEAGFGLPDENRLSEFISAGVDRAQAIQAYSLIALRDSEFMAFARRANLGELSLEDMEDQFLLGEQTLVAEAVRREAALGFQTRGFGFADQRGRTVQPGLATTGQA